MKADSESSVKLCALCEVLPADGVAALVYEALGLLGPIPNTPASDEIQP